MSDDGFEWCDIRDDQNGHVCAEYRPGHERHVCCCGATIATEETP